MKYALWWGYKGQDYRNQEDIQPIDGASFEQNNSLSTQILIVFVHFLDKLEQPTKKSLNGKYTNITIEDKYSRYPSTNTWNCSSKGQIMMAMGPQRRWKLIKAIA